MTASRARTFFLTLLGVLVLFPVAAQSGAGEGSPQLPIDSDWPDSIPDLYSRGDKIFGISVGPVLPTVFVYETGSRDTNISVGGALSLSYTYFFNSHLFLGGELEGMFATTIAKNALFIVPMGMRVGYQFIAGRFEFPLSLTVGFAPQTYLEKNFLGLFVKPVVSAFWRFNPDWSFGVNAAWWWVPQWSKQTTHGNFLELSVSARYHF
jgi:hypothetical protein